eukprot:6455208-Amphidinium_carterae.3
MSGDVHYWRLKLPLCAILENRADGRTQEGLKRALRKSEEKGSFESGVLRNYLKLVEVASTLATANLQSFADEELEGMLRSMDAEREQLPLGIKSKLVHRYCQNMLVKTDYTSLIAAMVPFGGTEWSRSAPCVASLPCDDESKVGTFEEFYLKEILAPMVQKGEHAKQEVRTFCDLMVTHVAAIDSLDLETVAANCRSNCLHICNCFVALHSDQLDIDKEVGWENKGSHDFFLLLYVASCW